MSGTSREKEAIQTAMRFEESRGRTPVDCSKKRRRGYDIESTAQDGSKRYIEVKSKSGKKKQIALSEKEWEKAQEEGNNYWLYIVVNAAQKTELYTIQNPAEKLKPTRFLVNDWEKYATKEVDP